MLKDYWDEEYTECPECGRKQEIRQFTTTFQCKNSGCSYQEKESKGIAKRRERVKKIVKEIAEYLLSNEKYPRTIPLLNFPELALPAGLEITSYDVPCAGWYDRGRHIISIPQKVFYLPNREIIEIVSHETAHVSTPQGHNEKWHHKYMDYRRKAFSKFSSFVNEPDNEAQYTIGLSKEFYKKSYGYNLEDLEHEPNEDD